MDRYKVEHRVLDGNGDLVMQISEELICQKEVIEDYIEKPWEEGLIDNIIAIKRLKGVLRCSLWFAKHAIDLLKEKSVLEAKFENLKKEIW